MSVASQAHPPGVLPAIRELAFVCPRCKGALVVEDTTYHCVPCAAAYPLHGGIPDFRLFDDPYLDREGDRVRTDVVLAALETMPMPQLLAHYWSFSDVTPPPLRAKFIDSVLRGGGRARRLLELMEREGGAAMGEQTLLEVGSGTGNLLAPASRRFRRVVGTDIAMRWLHVARRRFMEEGLEVPALVCCCAEHLPFPGGSFDVVASVSTLQFLRDASGALAECARVLKPAGAAYHNTVNRFTIAPEPHVELWGVGFMPRALQIPYVRMRRGAAYEPVRPLSRPGLARAARACFGRVRFELGDIDDGALASLPAGKRSQVRLYRKLKRRAPFAQLLGWLGPEWDVTLRDPRRGATGSS